MTYEKTDMLWDALRQFPRGATAKQVAAKLDRPSNWASAGLGKLAMYDIIDRVPNPTGRCGEFRYQIKQRVSA